MANIKKTKPMRVIVNANSTIITVFPSAVQSKTEHITQITRNKKKLKKFTAAGSLSYSFFAGLHDVSTSPNDKPTNLLILEIYDKLVRAEISSNIFSLNNTAEISSK